MYLFFVLVFNKVINTLFNFEKKKRAQFSYLLIMGIGT